MNLFPRKVTAEKRFFELTAPVVQAFLDFLQERGILSDVDRLKRAVGRWHSQILARSQDPDNWGMAKALAMEAMDRGLDPTDQNAMNQIIAEHNRRLTELRQAQQAYEPEPLVQPIVNESPKIGRNDPCPCGSGKKYKKCCGRPGAE